MDPGVCSLIAPEESSTGPAWQGIQPTSAGPARGRFAQPATVLRPAEDFLGAFTLLLANQIARMTSDLLINDSSGFAR